MASYHCLFLDGEGRPAWGEHIDAESDKVALVVARDRIGAGAAGAEGFAVMPLAPPAPTGEAGNAGPRRPVLRDADCGLVAGLVASLWRRIPRH